MKMRRKEKIILITALAGTVGLGVWLLYLWLYLWPEKAIERELAKIRARGEPVTLEELAPPEIPDAENAALIYEQAFGVYYEAPRKEGLHLSEILGKDLTQWTEEDIEVIREDLEKNEDCLHLLHQAANYDKCRFSLDYSPGYRILLGHLRKMRAQARLLARDALYKAKEGKIDEALESSRASLCLGRGLVDEPILISQLVRSALDEITLYRLQKILNENDASPEILRLLLKKLDVQESRAAFARSLQGERCCQIDIYEQVIKDPALIPQIVTNMGGRGPHSFVSMKGYKIMGPFARPIFRRDEIFSLNIMQKMIDLAKLPYHQAKADLDKLEQDVRKARFYCILTKELLPVLTHMHLQNARHEAKIGLAQLALALKIFKAEKGKYPDSLSELVPDILPELPKDPFTGKDFVYKKEGEGFLVYSLNENARDDGGIGGRPSEYDIPWRCKK